MSEQGIGGYRCQSCGATFNSLQELDTHTRKEHANTRTNMWG
jgi:transposase-like protein